MPIPKGPQAGWLRTGWPLLLVVLVSAASAWAHAVVVESSPEDGAVLARAPDYAVLRFNARIERGLSQVSLHAAGGRPIPLPPRSPAPPGQEAPDRLAVRLPELGPGAYEIRYRVLAADGHVTPGVLRFTVSQPP